ncbi:MAG: DUF1573 domain-containing protein [Flavobacteriales bacterium]|jgi:hypothetical protein|tara:strand:+ start:354 stop:791 length:438 start_codon:yes stop_codon:yes gene_type:complete
MKKLILGLGLILAFSFGVQAQELITGPAIELDKDVHDYGDIENGGDGTCEFTVTNIGTEPLIISRCKGSCGCTVPQCEKAPIAPGETSSVKVKYDTKRTGPINKSVTITSNAVNDPTKTVRIKGTVLAASSGTPVLQDSGAPVNN